jgi:hypothetical protein
MRKNRMEKIGTGTDQPARKPRSLEIAQAGLHTTINMLSLLTATIADALEETITTDQARVVIGAANTTVRIVELQYKYGKPRPGAPAERDLVLVGAGVSPRVARG